MDKKYHGSCHCGSIKFTLITNVESAIRCNCSLCVRRGAIMLTGKEGSFVLTEGKTHLGKYQFNTHVAEHFFCKICGIYTHHKPRSNPKIFRVNAGCVAEVNSADLSPGLNDGAALS